MNEEQQLKLQALMDGELSEDEAREASAWVAQDAEATALLRELRNTRQAFKTAEYPVQLPESREFFWSKIEREIEREERAPAPARSGLFRQLRRLLVPVGAAAVITLVGLLAARHVSVRPESEMAVADSGAFTYRDYANGTTLVWVSYPAER